MTETNDLTSTGNPVIKFSITDAGITELAERYKNPVVPTDKKEYEAIKVSIREVSKVRIAVEKEGKEQKRLALEHQRNVNSEMNRVVDLLKAIENPLKLCKAEVDEAEEKRVRDLEEAEAKRLETINARLANIEEYGKVSLNDTLDAVKKRLVRVNELDPNDRFDEFAKKAAEAKQASRESLTAAIEQITQREDAAKAIEAQQATLDKQAEDQAAAQKIIDDQNARIAKAQADKDDAERAAEQKRLQKLEDDEAERKAQEAAEAEAAHQRAIAPDREKLMVFAQSFRDIGPPVMSSDEGKMAIDRVIDQLTVIVSEIESEADRL